jgi:hypothetical protein
MQIMVEIDLHSNNALCGLMDESGRRLVHQKTALRPLYNPNPELQPAVESDVDGGSGVALKLGRLVSLVPPDSRPRNTKPTTSFRLRVKTGGSPTDFRLA